MRRRLRSAAFPLHRHSLPQLVVDAGLVALAYYLAFWLRFEDSSSTPLRYQRLLNTTSPWVVVGTVAILALSRVYQRRWRYVSQRDIEHVLRSLVVATVLTVAVVALVHPVLWLQKTGPLVGGHRVSAVIDGHRITAVIGGHHLYQTLSIGLPASIVVVFFLLSVGFLT